MGKEQLTTQTFIERCNLKHDNKYIYDKTIYTKSHDNVVVTCPIHGEFTIKAYAHLQGKGCKQCAIEQKARNRQSNTEQFIKQSKEIHGETFYIYDKTKYGKNNKEEVIITCPYHGDFRVTPNNHLSNKIGCPKCSNEFKAAKMATPFHIFVEKANKVHNNKYEYKQSTYKNLKTPIIATCPIHGDFKVYPNNHLRGQGCHKCNQSKLELIVESFLIENNIKFESQKRFEWLGKMSLDFYLPDYNVAIECQGIQHFEPIYIFGGESKFKQTVERDIKKKNYVNNIILNYCTILT